MKFSTSTAAMELRLGFRALLQARSFLPGSFSTLCSSSMFKTFAFFSPQRACQRHHSLSLAVQSLLKALKILYNISVLFVLFTLSVATAERSDMRFLLTPNGTWGQTHAEDYCAMYDICGARSDGKVLNCPFGSPAVKAIPFLVGCPACLRNFLNLFCELSCSPNQSLFINVTSVATVNGNLTVDGIQYYITDTFGEGLFESCKDVKFEWFAFVGRKVGLTVPGSPYLIDFQPTAPESSGMRLMNVTTYSCGDTSLGCSCGDCPAAPVCSNSAPPSSVKKGSCSVRIGSLKAKCIDFAVAIVYIILVSVFLGWGFFHRKVERSPAYRTRHVLNVANNREKYSANQQKDENPSIQEFFLLLPEFVAIALEVYSACGFGVELLRRYGTMVARNPVLVLCSSLAVVLLLCLGLIRFKVETRPEKLWVGPGSKAAEEKLFFDSHLAPFYRIEQLMLATIPDAMHGKSPSIVTENNINLLFEIQKKVDGIQANYSGSLVSLSDICLKPLGQDCATQSVLQYFKMDPTNYDGYGGVQHVEYCFQVHSNDPYLYVHYTTADTCLSAFKAPLDPSTALGGFSGNNYSEASAFIITYPVNNAIDKEGNESKRAVAWEKAFIQLVKVLLGLSGVMLVMLSVLGSVGIFSAFGIKSTLIIMEVIPFLVLAVGVDNMCILVHAVKRQPLELPLEGRISNALVEVGPSITLASLSEVLAFAVGSFIPMPACRVFSMFAALAVLLDFLLQITAFVALIVFDFMRAEEKRIDCFPCIKISGSYTDPNEGIGQRKPGLLTRYMKEVHAPILGLWWVKIVVISVFAALAFVSIALCTRIEPGLEQQIVLPRDSYLQIARASLTPESSYIAKPAASWLDDFLVWISPEAFGCCRKFTNGSYCPPNDQPACCPPDSGSCGIGGVCKDCTTCFRHSDLQNDRPSTAQFREKLPWFLDALPSADCAKGGHGAYTNGVELNGYEDGVIQASAFRTYHTPLNKQTDYVNSLRAAREFSSRVSNSLKIEIFPYSVFYMFFEQYLDIWRTALINLAIAIGAVFVVCLIITCSLWSSAIIILVLTMIVVDMMGVMAILHIQLNAVSVVNLVMSVGIAVEFCVHITHAFSVSSGDKNQRTKEALGTMGASVFSGITLTKLVGVLVLCFSRTEVFVVYYFQMYLALVLLGFLHGLVFLPVLLSIFGPPSRSLVMEKQDEQTPVPSHP
ncbi:hypothetical protein TEA_022929 [Camellia sinensis var. sinensis]|uniref:SSD domain-containing protein n=1 Tax=Camellia sinensis var. sinensis TaxID=542762 RepID=A0A4S4DVG5_CAMSN|nr:hypothetical protein TEA_022929 [Camellia sinensis var. sinensis]